MGVYVNPENIPFKDVLNSEIYVDKTNLLAFTNKVMDTEDKYILVSKPRGFGKSITANMLAAYYSKGCNSAELFKNLHISTVQEYSKHLNKYPVIFLDMQRFRNIAGDNNSVLALCQNEVINELKKTYSEYVNDSDTSLPLVLSRISSATGDKFVIIIDEWDCIFRNDKYDTKAQEKYIEFLRSLFKGNVADGFIKLAYITGILPIKKYGTQSALNNFKEYTMTSSRVLAGYVGFTENEVKDLCAKYDMDFDKMKVWYDGYSFSRVKSVYNPKSVVEALSNHEFNNYWTRTETYEALKLYIDMNFDGLKDAVVQMLSGQRCSINISSFQNDMTTLKTKDDVFTLLVHLGYLGYDEENKQVFIPNQEIMDEFEIAVTGEHWNKLGKVLKASDDLLKATLNGDEEFVAKALDDAHSDVTSILTYNNENSLSCVISIAYYCARKDYVMIRELPTGKGFADIVFVPRRGVDKPAFVVELKWDKSAEGAIKQIKDKQYVKALENYGGKVLLVGVNYDTNTKKHSCVIEK